MESSSKVRAASKDAPLFEVFSPSMRRLLEISNRIARVDSTVLITGESGVGKERLAQFIHRASGRATRPFITVNCGALSEALVESELFGHMRGAFTGAVHDHPGLFEAANGGVLLLDEIADVPLAIQVKLLRVVQEREVRRLGENRQRRIDVRLIAATNRNLKDDVKKGRFRQDLYFRLNVVELHIPPLRERIADLCGLLGMLQRRIASRMGSGVAGYTDAAFECLLQYDWPGNIRELENVIERACAFATGALIDVGDLPAEVRDPGGRTSSKTGIKPLFEVERDHILSALQRNHGNKVITATQLRIGRTTLFRKLKTYTDPS